MFGAIGASAGIDVPLCLLFRKGTLQLLRRCRRGLDSFFRVGSGSSMGGSLGGVNILTGVRGRFSFRATQRAGTALLVCGKTRVAAIRGLLKRRDMGAARECDSVFSKAVMGSLGGYGFWSLVWRYGCWFGGALYCDLCFAIRDHAFST